MEHLRIIRLPHYFFNTPRSHLRIGNEMGVSAGPCCSAHRSSCRQRGKMLIFRQYISFGCFWRCRPKMCNFFTLGAPFRPVRRSTAREWNHLATAKAASFPGVMPVSTPRGGSVLGISTPRYGRTGCFARKKTQPSVPFGCISRNRTEAARADRLQTWVEVVKSGAVMIHFRDWRWV